MEMWRRRGACGGTKEAPLLSRPPWVSPLSLLTPHSSLAFPGLHPLRASQPNPPGTLQAWVLPVHPPPPRHTAPAPFPPLVSWLPCCWLSCRLHVLVTQWSPQRGPLLLTPPLALAPASPRSTLRTSPPCVSPHSSSSPSLSS